MEAAGGGGGGAGAAEIPEWGGAAVAAEGWDWAAIERGLREVANTTGAKGILPEEPLPPGHSEEVFQKILFDIARSKGHQLMPKAEIYIHNVLDRIKKPQSSHKALIVPIIDDTNPFLTNLTKSHPIQVSKEEGSVYQNIIEKQAAGPVAKPCNATEDPMSPCSNAVKIPFFESVKANPPTIFPIRAKKKGVSIANDIEDAVYRAFSGSIAEIIERGSRDISQFPIYLIGAFPDQGRHLTIAVFFKGELYSCGVASASESGTTMGAAFEDPETSSLAPGVFSAAGAVASGAGPQGAAFSSGFGVGSGSVSVRHGHFIGSGTSAGGKAQILSPDFMFKILNSRIFDIGILRPEHIQRLKAYFSKMTDDVIMTFKYAKDFLEGHFIGHAFNHFEFPLNARFSAISSPLVVNNFLNYLNCTTFVLSIFKDIECPTRFAGKFIVDPSECVSKKYESLETTGAPPVLQKLIKQTLDSYKINNWQKIYQKFGKIAKIKLWLLQQDPKSTIKYRDRDSFVGIMLFRFLRQYVPEPEKIPESEKDPSLFPLLVKDHDKTAEETIANQIKIIHHLAEAARQADMEAAATEARLVAMAAAEAAGGGGGGGAGSKSYGGRRRQRKSCKRKSKAHRQPRKRRSTKRR